MRHAAFALALALGCTLTLAAQDKDKKPKTISLSGCIASNEKTPGRFTLADEKGGSYRLSGARLKDYIGRRVTIAGGVVETKRFTIKGGLTPNANVAAQAGAYPVPHSPVPGDGQVTAVTVAGRVVAVASAGGASGPGTVELPEFKVRSVRPVSGTCP